VTKYSFANLDAWVGKVERRMNAVVKQSANNMLKDIDISVGIMRGGRVERGTIPRDLGALANSLQSSLYGSTGLTTEGKNSYVLAIGQLQAGDRATFTWGGVNAPYARAIHYGFDSYPGTWWRDEAAAKWPQYVAAATIRAKALIP
jgi:hypothetical protein